MSASQQNWEKDKNIPVQYCILSREKVCEENKILADEKGKSEKRLRKNKAQAGLGELKRIGRLKKQRNMPTWGCIREEFIRKYFTYG